MAEAIQTLADYDHSHLGARVNEKSKWKPILSVRKHSNFSLLDSINYVLVPTCLI